MFHSINYNAPFPFSPEEFSPFLKSPHPSQFSNCRNQYNRNVPVNSTCANNSSNSGLNQTNDKVNSNNQRANNKEEKWPYVDITEYPNHYVIDAELPGFKKEDLDISFDSVDKVLTLKGTYVNRSKKHEDLVIIENEIEGQDDDSVSSINTACINNDGKVLLNERKAKKNFKRNFKIRQVINPNEIQTDLADGMLNLIVPKRKKQEDKRVKISIQ